MKEKINVIMKENIMIMKVANINSMAKDKFIIVVIIFILIVILFSLTIKEIQITFQFIIFLKFFFQVNEIIHLMIIFQCFLNNYHFFLEQNLSTNF